MAGTKSYYRINPDSAAVENVGRQLFTVEVPRLVTPSDNLVLVFTGVPNTEFWITVKVNSIPVEVKGKLDASGVTITDYTNEQAATYTFETIRIMPPGTTQWKTLGVDFRTTSVPTTALVTEKLSVDKLQTNHGHILDVVSKYLGSNDGVRWQYQRGGYGTVTYGIAEQ